MTWYLIKVKGRLVITRSTPPKKNIIDSTEARNWIDAKAKLGFPLTPIQFEMLART